MKVLWTTALSPKLTMETGTVVGQVGEQFADGGLGLDERLTFHRPRHVEGDDDVELVAPQADDVGGDLARRPR